MRFFPGRFPGIGRAVEDKKDLLGILAYEIVPRHPLEKGGIRGIAPCDVIDVGQPMGALRVGVIVHLGLVSQ